MNELQKTHSMLNKLEELNNSKFNSSEFISLHSDLQTSLDKIGQNKDGIKEKLSIEDKSSIINLISKIESLEAKILPKADLVNSFSKSRM
tara:strand:+ start:1517 stop:1786 length:270 start_codon:yes stop_codon:yes gene_type:complete